MALQTYVQTKDEGTHPANYDPVVQFFSLVYSKILLLSKPKIVMVILDRRVFVLGMLIIKYRLLESTFTHHCFEQEGANMKVKSLSKVNTFD